MVKCLTCLKTWWFSREVKCNCAKPKRMVENNQSRIYMNLKTRDDSTQHYDEATFKRLFLNHWPESESQQPTHQDKFNHCEPSPIHNSHASDHSHSSCNSFGASDYGSSSGSDYSSPSSSSSDF